MVWEWAKKHGFTIVSKDTDFHQRAIVFGHPPKIIWLRVGNCETSLITNLLRSRYQLLRQFIESETESLFSFITFRTAPAMAPALAMCGRYDQRR